MLVKRTVNGRSFTAGDGSRLREILNPEKNRRLKIRYSLARASVAPGRETRPHVLRHAEVYYILQGTGQMRVGRDRRRIKAGDTVYIPPGSVQQIRNAGRQVLVFLCLVDPAWTPGCEKVLKMR